MQTNDMSVMICPFFDLDQGCTNFCYCRPHYFYLYEVWSPM